MLFDTDYCTPRSETIRVDLIVFLAIFADVATIAIAYGKRPVSTLHSPRSLTLGVLSADNAQSSRKPVEWQLPKIWIVSTILGILLAVGTWIMRGVLFISHDGKGGIIQNYGSMQEILFLEVALTESWLILVTRSEFLSYSFSLITS